MLPIRIAALGLLAGVGAVWVATDRADRRRAATEPSLPDGEPRAPVRLSVVIPVRDEEQNLGPCLESLLAQTRPPDEVIVVDDGSRDGTAAIARRFAARDARIAIVAAGPLPAGWTGKSHAIREGASRVMGDRLLFLDADTRLEPRCLASALGYAERERIDLLSLTARQLALGVWERAVQPVIYALLDRHYPLGPDAGAANGQFLLVSAAAYAAAGTHEAVRGEIVEDVALARRFRDAGLSTRFVAGRRHLSTRMYRSLRGLWEGWGKNAFALFAPRWGDTALQLAARIVPWAAPLGFAAAGDPVAAGVAAAAPALGLACDARIRARAGFDARDVRLQPLGALLVTAILARSAVLHALRRPLRWKGREYAPGSHHTRGRPDDD